MIKLNIALLVIFYALRVPAMAQILVPAEQRQDLQLTIYYRDTALVEETRSVEVKLGLNEFELKGVPMLLRPETVLFPDHEVKELRFINNPPTYEKIYRSYIGKEVLYVKSKEDGQEEAHKAILLALINEAPVLQVENRVELFAPGRIVVPSLPKELTTDPALLVSVNAKKAGKVPFRFMYLTGGLSWAADYVVVLSEDEKRLRLDGYASIQNNSGMPYRNTKLRLVSGEVKRVSPLLPNDAGLAFATKAAEPSLIEQPSSEYHLYSLPGQINLDDGELKQLLLLSAPDVAIEKEYRFQDFAGFVRGADGRDNGANFHQASLVYRFQNKDETGLGKAMPAGVVRVYSQDGGKSLYLGESRIGNIPSGEMVELEPGSAFDVTAAVRQTSFDVVSANERHVAIEMTMNNRRDQEVVISVTESIPGAWEIVEENEKHDASRTDRAEWRVVIPGKSSKALTYKVRITMPQ